MASLAYVSDAICICDSLVGKKLVTNIGKVGAVSYFIKRYQ